MSHPRFSKDARGTLPEALSADTRNFLAANQPLFQFLENVIRIHYPPLYKLLDQLRASLQKEEMDFLGGIFPGFALNFDVKTFAHKDVGDKAECITLLISFGDFEGGSLYLKEPKIEMPFSRGSILIFRAAMLTHFNADYTGHRNSIVFFLDKGLTSWFDRRQGPRPKFEDLDWSALGL